MIDYGPHSAYVVEVLEFVQSGGVLRSPFNLNQSHYQLCVITSLDDVGRYRDGDVPGAAIAPGTSWWDIKQVDASKLYEGADAIPMFWDTVRQSIVDASNSIEEALRVQLGVRIPRGEIRNIADDFEMIMMFRAAFGVVNCIDEHLFDVYRHGGYPCGWEGKFPAGRLVVFSR